MPMHWGSQFMNSAGVNALTVSATDPFSLQPELKHTAVAISKVDLPWQLVILRKAGEGGLSALPLLAQARSLLQRFDYVTVGLYGRADPLVVFRAAMSSALTEDCLHEIDVVFGLDDESAIVYADHRRQISKRAVASDGRLVGVRLAGETLAQSWLKEAMTDNALDAAMIRWAVAPIGNPPGPLVEKSRIVCVCADITEARLKTELNQGEGLALLQEKLKCGTFCGSCVPELKRIAAGRTQEVIV